MARYQALDALRGLTIALMILVNTPGSWSYVYSPLLHADWHGCTPTDLVFPFFMFIIGSSMYFSFKKSNFEFSSTQLLRIIKRGSIIFAIGLFLNIYPFTKPLEELRILGVLQRIALAYVLAAVIVLIFKRFGVIALSAAILVGYWLLLLTVGQENAYSLENNLVRSWDIKLLTESHLWQGKGIAFDPEGLLSTFPAVVSVLFGFEITRLITSKEDKWQSISWLVGVGVIAIVVGQVWGQFFPVNKSLWTSTFVLYTSGIACLVLAFFVWLCDVVTNKTWVNPVVNPLVVYGTNPLFVYVLSGLIVKTYAIISIAGTTFGGWMYQSMASIMDNTFASFLYALAHVILLWLVSKKLFEKNIIIKI